MPKAKPKKKQLRGEFYYSQELMEKSDQQTANRIADYVEKRLSPYIFREYLEDCVNAIREGRWRE